jgi:hypothetical protein
MVDPFDVDHSAVQSAEHRIQSAEHRIQSAEHRMSSRICMKLPAWSFIGHANLIINHAMH